MTGKIYYTGSTARVIKMHRKDDVFEHINYLSISPFVEVTKSMTMASIDRQGNNTETTGPIVQA
ncbi:hypothetical protein E4U47_005061 [Claviceps purpurea]|nr:hypothetical protein E4U47_005061 [Claviceps purpurea]